MNMIKLYGKPIRVNKATSDKKNLDVGANLFIGNLDPDIDEKLLYDTFSAFGQILQTPKVSNERRVVSVSIVSVSMIMCRCFPTSVIMTMAYSQPNHLRLHEIWRMETQRDMDLSPLITLTQLMQQWKL